MHAESRFAVKTLCRVLASVGLAAVFCAGILAQQDNKKQPSVPGPMLNGGTVDFDTPEFALSLVR